MLSRTALKPRKRNAPRPAEKSCRAFLQFVRTRDCLFVDDGSCEGKIEAAHLDFAGGKGIGSKVADKYAIPLCAHHHRQQHLVGWATFLLAMHVTKEELISFTERIWNAWGGRAAWERKLSDG